MAAPNKALYLCMIQTSDLSFSWHNDYDVKVLEKEIGVESRE